MEIFSYGTAPYEIKVVRSIVKRKFLGRKKANYSIGKHELNLAVHLSTIILYDEWNFFQTFHLFTVCSVLMFSITGHALNWCHFFFPQLIISALEARIQELQKKLKHRGLATISLGHTCQPMVCTAG